MRTRSQMSRPPSETGLIYAQVGYLVWEYPLLANDGFG
jgi:hypothetical protein